MNRDIGIDIGTKNTYIYSAASKSVSSEPSAAAVDIVTGTPIALGAEAQLLCMRTPGGNRLVYPLESGDSEGRVDFTARLLGFHTANNRSGRLRRPKVAFAVPPDISKSDEERLSSAVLEGGAAEAVLIEAPLAAAVGSGRDVYSSVPTVIVDAGASKTASAIISEGKVKHYISAQVGGNAISAAIINFIKNKYSLLISSETAEELKTTYVSFDPKPSDKTVETAGIALISGLPQNIYIKAAELSAAALVPVMAISDQVCAILDKLTAEYGDHSAAGAVVIVGGTAKLTGLSGFIAAETGVPASVADNPGSCTALGLGIGLG